tara:strand:+ start:7023 stop:7952 length:930 start_codon:yes stop_codon:yes gene_type:complete
MKKKLSNLKSTFYRRPKDEISRMLRWGPKAYFRCDAWAREMEDSVASLAVPVGENSETISCWFLTGRRFWYQTAYCAWTLAKQASATIELNLVDDGSLSTEYESRLRRLFPAGTTVRKSTIEERVNDLLPVSKFPLLRERWIDYINIRKLTDVHLGSEGPKLVLDSDMLFFKQPTELLEWIRNPQGTCLMTDCVESYGYSRALMESLCGSILPSKLNVGICGLRSEQIEWEQMEDWCQRLHAAEGTSYYLEQALVAMLAAQPDQISVMPASDYITFPTHEQVKSKMGVLQHYVADSKPWYFGKAWRLSQ